MDPSPPRHHRRPTAAAPHPTRGRRRPHRGLLAVLASLLAVAAGAAVAAHLSSTAGASSLTRPASPGGIPSPDAVIPPPSACPWLATAMAQHLSPADLAAMVVQRMTLSEKLGEVALIAWGGNENLNLGVPRLCIPRLTLQDGPQGIGYDDVHVTQLPSPLGLAATFDPSEAARYGRVLGSEAKGQGIDVIQSPNVNVDRIPENGRAYEGFGEDPLLISEMGVAEIEGIQSQGTLAQAKHLVAYGQEADRGQLDDVVSERALQELYLKPFKAAIQQGHVDSLMCAYPRLNGVFQCQDPTLTRQTAAWGFTGFVRSDLGAVHDPVAALAAGTDLIKPASIGRLARSVEEGILPVSDVNAAVTRVLTTMFATGLIGRDVDGTPSTPVDSLADALVARQTAERSAVLLQDRASVLPLSTHTTSLAVIGADAGPVPSSSGYGSSYVTPTFTSTPLGAMKAKVASGTKVRFADGGSTTKAYPPIPSQYLRPSTGTGQGLTLTVAPTNPTPGATPVRTLDPNISVVFRGTPSILAVLPGTTANPAPDQRDDHDRSGAPDDAGGARTRLDLPADWSDVTATWTGTLTPPRTGLYALSVKGSGKVTVSLDGVPVVSDPDSHVLGVWSQSAQLIAGHPYRVQMVWHSLNPASTISQSRRIPSSMSLGWEYATPAINAAVAAARSSQVAVVFAGVFSSEGYDRPSLDLPGDENELISAVAAVNPRTVVVLNSGGPVVMPWLHQVAGVVEDWYPGEEDGDAITAVLFGNVDPSARLPVTFPTSQAKSAIHSVGQFPGVNLVSTYSEGLEVGYRWNNATGVRPLFPFGYGLSYTRFTQQLLSSRTTDSGTVLRVRVTNRGHTTGADVPQAYLTFPAAADEPPAQLAAFARVSLRPGRSATVSLHVPSSAFASYQGSRWTTVPGTYTLSVGESSEDHPLQAKVTLR
jgi:beta-glucosidase